MASMRVITGQAKGTKLASPQGQEIRPTCEMAKEAIFSILQNETPGSTVLDLFAGSGQLGIEALSRGAVLGVFVDQSRQAQRVILENLKKCGLAERARVISADYSFFLSGTTEQFDIALLDPPYKQGILEDALPKTAAVMKAGGVILCETDRNESLPETAGEFVKTREYRYGKSKITAYRHKESTGQV